MTRGRSANNGRRVGTRAIAALVIAGSLALTARARAQEKHDPVAADYLFREARKAAQAGDYKKACPMFADSQRLDPGAGVLMNLADCEEHLGQVASAWEHWREAIDAMAGKNDRRLSLAKRKVAALEKRLPRLTLRLDAHAPADARVEKDGVELGGAALGLPVPVDPGAHVIVVKAPKHESKRFDVSLKEADNVELPIDAGAAIPEKPPEIVERPPEAKPKPNPLRTAGWVAIGVGGAGLALSAITGLIAIDKKNTVSQHCAPDPAGGVACRDQQGLDAASSGGTMSTVSTIGFVVGLVGVAGGVTLLFTQKGTGATATTALGARALPGGGALSVSGEF